MSIFKKIFGGNKYEQESQIDNSKYSIFRKKGFKTFADLVDQNAGLSFEKQMIFGEIIGAKAWDLDMQEGSISFGDLKFPIQIIGSLAFNNNSWMWGWANSQSGMPENLLVQSNQLKEIGEKKSIKELSEGHFNVNEGFEHKIGVIASGILNLKSYYCANYGQGTLVVTIADTKIPVIDKGEIEKVLTTFPQLISGMEVNHKNAFENYLIDRDFKLKIEGNSIEGLRNGKVIIAKFDKIDRLKSLNAKI